MARNQSTQCKSLSSSRPKNLKIHTKPISRKELRKQKQIEKKQRKHQFFSKQTKDDEKQRNSNNNKHCGVINGEQKVIQNVGLKKTEDELLARNLKSVKEKVVKKTMISKSAGGTEELSIRNRKRQKDLEIEARKQRIKQLKLDNAEDDKEIARLEKKLKLNKSKNKNRLVRKMFSDGLDFALEICLNDDDDNDGKENKMAKKKKKYNEDDGNESPREEEDEARFNEIFGSPNVSDDDSEGEEQGTTKARQMASNGRPTSPIVNLPENGNTTKTKYREDIYGRKRDEHGNIIKENDEVGRFYVPPQRRNMISNENCPEIQLIEALTKQCKGLLNRLSEANLHKIANGIEKLYMNNSRHNMNQTLTKLFKEALIQSTLTNERMVQEYMVLLSYLHAQIGTEIGAHFLQVFIEEYDKLLTEQINVEDKRLNNVLMILCYMYIFGLYNSRLISEIIGRFTICLNEKAIECILLIYQTVGFRLRKDDPSYFLCTIRSVQIALERASDNMKDNVRAKYMIDVLKAIKSNNVNKIPKYDPNLYDNLRKKLRAMLSKDKYVTALNIPLGTLLSVETAGKWWIVGSAWSGNIQETASAQKSTASVNAVAQHECKRFPEKLLKLAKELQINTPERRNIFYLIMSANDPVEAFEKVLHLNLKDQRSVAYVLIHCCLNEKCFNPYYVHLAMKFCNYNRKYQLAFQFASWDRINDIEVLNKTQLKNFANFLKDLILLGGLQLSVLKVINFLELDNKNFILMRDTCIGILLSRNEEAIYGAFQRLATNTKLKFFKQSFRLFLQHFLLDGTVHLEKLSNKDKIKLKENIDRIDNLLAYVDL